MFSPDPVGAVCNRTIGVNFRKNGRISNAKRSALKLKYPWYQVRNIM